MGLWGRLFGRQKAMAVTPPTPSHWARERLERRQHFARARPPRFAGHLVREPGMGEAVVLLPWGEEAALPAPGRCALRGVDSQAEIVDVLIDYDWDTERVIAVSAPSPGR